MSWFELLLIPLGFAVGAFGTMVGAGGGFVLVPVLLLVYQHDDPAQITAISLAVVFANATSGSAAYARLRKIDYLTGCVFAAAAIPGSIAGALVVGSIPRDFFDLLFGVSLLVLASYTAWSVGRAEGVRSPVRGWGVVTREMRGDEPGSVFRYSYSMPQGIAYSASVGFVSSLLGIGGGVVHVPIMITLLRFPVHIAVATSHFVLAITAASGSGVHLFNGDLGGHNLARAGLLSLGVVPGAQVGARLAQRFHGPVIARLLATALVIVGVRLLYAGVTG
jgi:uncharacterized membrane protein YfcA